MLGHMAIQFQCPACSQPIEVDDEWSDKPVACPYCRKTVTAPQDSTLTADAAVTMASPISPVAPEGVTVPGYDPAYGGGPAYDPQPKQRNPMAVWSIVLSSAALVLYVAGSVLAAIGLLGFLGPDATPQQMQDVVEDVIQRGELPTALAIGVCAVMLALPCWLVGLVLGIIALSRTRAQRGLVIISLVICGVLFLFLAVSFALQAG